MSPGEIAGIAIGSVLGAAAVAILAVYLLLVLPRQRNKQFATGHNQRDRPPEVQGLSKPGVVQELPGAAAAQELPAN